ncbi:MAG: hypothetical protein C6H99_07705 [Epsilonproteobacteria bacterium]|nr:hypothetical protein [Campylobacterota bacterium]NPA64369.1 hypothetical protein [Campylobacterota bacterium]
MRVLLLSDDTNVERVVKIATAIKGAQMIVAQDDPSDLAWDVAIIDQSFFDRIGDWDLDGKRVIYLYKDREAIHGKREGMDLKKPFLPKDLIRLLDAIDQDQEPLVPQEALEGGGVLDHQEVQKIQELLDETSSAQTQFPMRLQDIVTAEEMDTLKKSLAQMSFELDQDLSQTQKQIDIVMDRGEKDINITITINLTLQEEGPKNV